MLGKNKDSDKNCSTQHAGTMRIGRHSLKSLITALTPESIGYSKRVGRFSDLSLPLRAFPQHCVAVTYDARVLKE